MSVQCSYHQPTAPALPVDLFSSAGWAAPVILDKITKFESCENHHSNILSGLKIHTKLWDLVKRTNFHLFSHDIHNLYVSPRQFLSQVKAEIK